VLRETTSRGLCGLVCPSLVNAGVCESVSETENAKKRNVLIVAYSCFSLRSNTQEAYLNPPGVTHYFVGRVYCSVCLRSCVRFRDVSAKPVTKIFE